MSAVDVQEPAVDPRARRAIPLIAAALAVIMVAGLLYLRPPAHVVLKAAPPVPQLTPGYNATYDFVTPTMGWAAVEQMNTAAFYIFQTTDGAQHWRKQFSVLSTPFASLEIQFFDANHGFVNLDRLYRTSDGGAHWNVISVPDGTPDFTFPDANHGWADDGMHLYSTSDGGLTWQTAGSLPPDASPAGKGGFHALTFRADGEGWVGGTSPTPMVYTTRNGGATWRSIQLPAFPPNPSAIGGKPYFISTSVWVTPGGVLALATDGFGQGNAFMSADMGRSWQTIKFPGDPLRLGNFSFIDSRHWWLSSSGILYTTSNAGRSWTSVIGANSANISDWNQGAATAMDAQHGWCVITSPSLRNGASGLAMTSDGGRHWAPVNVPNPPA
jgi:photosystem II stability/assembly factor-like uncharacterized protein